MLAGLYDAVCENVQVLLRPQLSPPDVLLVGGVVRAPRVRENFRRFLESRGMCLRDRPAEDSLYLEALGAALIAAEQETPLPALDQLFEQDNETEFERIPPLRASLPLVHRMPDPGTMEAPTSSRTVTRYSCVPVGAIVALAGASVTLLTYLVARRIVRS